MSQTPISTESASRRSGTLNLYLTEPGDPHSEGEKTLTDTPPYARFRMTRGFLDDLNRMLPIRLRIQLETEINKGRNRGRIEGKGPAFHWEFTQA